MLDFHFAPQSRAIGVHWLLEELEVPYTPKLVDFRAEGGVPENYRAIQPHKKVPAIVHDGKTITERAAICLYLTETFPERGLAPRVGDPNRGQFLTWLVYADSVFDPALSAKIAGFVYEPSGHAYGSFEDMLGNLERTLAKRPYIAGETFTAADTQIASGIGWASYMTDHFKGKVFRDYLERCQARPAHARVLAKAAA